MPLVLDDQVLLVDGLQQSRGQRLEVGDRLRRGWQAAARLLQEQLLDCEGEGTLKVEQVETERQVGRERRRGYKTETANFIQSKECTIHLKCIKISIWTSAIFKLQ